MGLFDFIADIGNYDDRVIARFEDDRVRVLVSTCRVSDGRLPCETAVQHPDYHNGIVIIVEAYNDNETARKGHDAWVARMTSEPLPDELTDCLNCEFAHEYLDHRQFIFRRSTATRA